MKGAPRAIHVIERREFIRPVPGLAGEFTSGFWCMPLKVAQQLHGADIYFHKRQKAPSFLGGRILDSRAATPDEYPKPGRVVFRFSAVPAHAGVSTSAAGWSREKKYVR